MRRIKLSLIVPADCFVVGQDIEINALNLCNRNSIFGSVLSYVESDKYIYDIKNNKSIKSIIIKKNLFDIYNDEFGNRLTYIIAEYPESVFYSIHDYLYNNTDFYDKFDFLTQIGENCEISSSAVIEKGVIIGNSVKIGHNSVIRRGSVLEDNVSIGCNTTIGSEGFQIISLTNSRINVKHAGGTLLKSYSYVGDNTAICNSLFEGYTLIGKNARIDNLVHVAHNCIVHDNVILTAGVILCGSTTIQDNAWIGTNTTILNNVVIGENTKIGIGSVVTKSIPSNVVAYGVPAKVPDKYLNKI